MKRVDVLQLVGGDGHPVATIEVTHSDVATIMAALSIAGGVMRGRGEVEKDRTFRDMFKAFHSELSDLWKWT